MAPTATTKTVEEPPKETPKKKIERRDVLDISTFEQILEMDDDDEDREFSREIVYGFFDQAKTTFEKMDKALTDKDLPELSSLGHFLKGSSATLGLYKVKDHCEKIQHYGARTDVTGTVEEPDDEKSLKKIAKSLSEVKFDYDEAEQYLRWFFGEKVSS